MASILKLYGSDPVVRWQTEDANREWFSRATALLSHLGRMQGREMFAPRCNLRRLEVLIGHSARVRNIITARAQATYNAGVEDGRRMECER